MPAERVSAMHRYPTERLRRDTTKIQKLIYEAYARSGGRPEWVESDAFVFYREHAHPNFEELVCLVRKRLAKLVFVLANVQRFPLQKRVLGKPTAEVRIHR